jgi:hypothetical protein
MNPKMGNQAQIFAQALAPLTCSLLAACVKYPGDQPLLYLVSETAMVGRRFQNDLSVSFSCNGCSVIHVKRGETGKMARKLENSIFFLYKEGLCIFSLTSGTRL